jgi:putative ABC transport system ATP-binding protein
LDPLFHTEGLTFGGFLNYGNLVFPAGKITFVTGESGSGKSTLLKMLNGTTSPSGGQVFYRGDDIASLDAVALRREVSLVSQEPFLFEGTIRDNFEAYFGYRDEPLPPEEEIKKLLRLFLLDFKPDALINTFSGGERQRLFIALYLSFRPKVLLLDEPTSALDSATAVSVLTGIIESCRKNGAEVVAVSHNTEMARRFSEHTLSLEKKVVS